MSHKRAPSNVVELHTQEPNEREETTSDLVLALQITSEDFLALETFTQHFMTLTYCVLTDDAGSLFVAFEHPSGILTQICPSPEGDAWHFIICTGAETVVLAVGPSVAEVVMVVRPETLRDAYVNAWKGGGA